jgi:formylglycine-generating enzyme required for sulfatase activity
VRNFEDFVLAMQETEKLRERKEYDRALQVVGRYTSSGRQEWADIARGKRLQLKKERFIDRGLVFVEGGRFTTGSKDPADGNPQKEVTLRPFYVGKFEVTNSDYLKFVKSTGQRAPEDWPEGKPQDSQLECPAVMITVKDAAAYCAWLTKKEGVKYRLPTEAEWEMAASWDGRAKRTFPWGDEFRKDTCNLEGRLLPVGQCKGDVSPAGAYDMAGNACELARTVDGGGCVIRGGCCDDAGNQRSARTTCRQKCDETTAGSSIGFRVVREDE